jgi:hypothetical protein
MMLDATAGYRYLWKNKAPPRTVFLDKRPEVKPDVVGVWKYLPFREDVCNCVLFDPPHIVRSGGYDPRYTLHIKYGAWGSKREAVVAIYQAQKAFTRVAPRLCFKWCNTREGPTLWGLLPLFQGFWEKVAEKVRKTGGQGTARGQTFWITFVRRE